MILHTMIKKLVFNVVSINEAHHTTGYVLYCLTFSADVSTWWRSYGFHVHYTVHYSIQYSIYNCGGGSTTRDLYCRIE